MSLIDEALRQARLEAARRELTEKGLPYTGAPTHMPPTQQPRRYAAPALIVTLLLLVAVAAFVAGRTADSPAEMTGTEEASPETASAAELSSGEVALSTTSAISAKAGGSDPVDPALEDHPAIETRAGQQAGTAGVVPARAPTEPVERQDTTAVRVLTTGGATLKLEGIVWSETRPLAVLNGRIAGAGEVVDGFTILSVQQESIEVRYQGETFEIVLR